MKKTFLITGALLALTATVASAAGINLYWNECSSGTAPAPATNKVFACASNAGTNNMYASFDPPAGVTELNGNNLLIDLQSATNPLPQWWRFKNAGTCRATSLSANTVFAASGACVDPWSGGSPGIAAYVENPGGDPQRARIAGSISITTGAPAPSGQEYYSLIVAINNAKTIGTGSCAGCQDPVCLVLNEIKLTQPAGTAGGSPVITNPLTSNFVTWQGGAIGGAGCPGATPAVNRTWGSVKAIYR
jgi:hypothetical protein